MKASLSRNPTPACTTKTSQILVLENEPAPSDSDESIFSPVSKQKTTNKTNTPENIGKTLQDPRGDQISEIEDYASSENEANSGSETEDESSTESDDDDRIFDNPNEPTSMRNPVGPNIITVPDNLTTRRDNLVIFTTKQGIPIDQGARLLADTNSLPLIRNATLGRARVDRNGSRHIVSLIIKERASEVTEKEIIKEALHSLLDVIIELDLPSISIAKSNVDNVPWKTVYMLITQILSETRIKIFVCTNDITIPPEESRQQLISENHCSAVGGHKGVTKTYNRIKKRYHWIGMKANIQSYIKNCRACQLKKLVRVKTRQPMVLTDTPDSAFDKVSMDIMGPLPVTQSGNSYILTIQDLLTKYSLAIPLQHAGAIEVADAFTNELVCIFGAPKAILTDQGSHFLNSLMQNIARKFKIKHYKTTAYRPQANGSVERSHQVLWEYLKQFVNKNSEWDKCLKLASLSYNTSVHEGTQYTPHELVFGKSARVPTSDPAIADLTNESYAEYLTTLFNKIKDAQATARENLISAKEESKKYYDRKARARNFKVGDNVYLLKEPMKGKLGDQYVGPYRILETLKNYNVKLAISATKTRVVHADKLKHEDSPTPGTLYQRTSDGGPTTTQPSTAP
ncbi:Gypsy retrotransposon integrase-like protein 1 [Camponotus japonicus]